MLRLRDLLVAAGYQVVVTRTRDAQVNTDKKDLTNDGKVTLSDDLQTQVMTAAAETERSQFELLANRTTENYARMRANGVAIAEPAPASVVAALRQAAAEPLAAWKAKVNDEAIAIVDLAIRQ